VSTRDWRLVVLGGLALGVAAYLVAWWAVIVVWVLWVLAAMAFRVWREREED
jgi:hypothetical protein